MIRTNSRIYSYKIWYKRISEYIGIKKMIRIWYKRIFVSENIWIYSNIRIFVTPWFERTHKMLYFLHCAICDTIYVIGFSGFVNLFLAINAFTTLVTEKDSCTFHWRVFRVKILENFLPQEANNVYFSPLCIYKFDKMRSVYTGGN